MINVHLSDQCPARNNYSSILLQVYGYTIKHFPKGSKDALYIHVVYFSPVRILVVSKFQTLT